MSTSGYKTTQELVDGIVVNYSTRLRIQSVSRDIEFLVDKADVDETNYITSAQNVAMVFQKTQAVPEKDAYFFSKVATTAAALGSAYSSSTAISTYSENNVLTKIKGVIAKVKRYRRSLVVYVRSAVMDLLELSTQLQRKVEMTVIPDGGIGIETRYTMIDAVPILEAIDEDRFYDKFNFNPTNGGFEPIAKFYQHIQNIDSEDIVKENLLHYLWRICTYTYTEVEEPNKNNLNTYYELTTEAVEGSKKINVLAASTETVVTVPKISSIYFFAPGAHTLGDGWLFQQREDYDTFIFPNGKDGQIDSIAVDIDTTEYTD